MLEILSVIALGVIAIVMAWVYWAYKHWKSEYFRMEASLQHERYSNRMVVDFMHAVADSYDAQGQAKEISKDKIFDSVMRTAIRGTRAMSVCIFSLREKDGLFVPVASTGLFPLLDGYRSELKSAPRIEQIRAHFLENSYPKDFGVFAPAIKTGNASLVTSFPARENAVLSFPDSPSFPRSVIVAPVYSTGKLSGLIVIANPRHGGEFTASEIKLGDILAQQFATALQMRDLLAIQAEKLRLDSELGIAASVQKLLLPHYIPQAHSLSIAATYRPAQKIGGDLYDVFDLGGGRIAAIVADVAGHGVSSALLMAICRTHFQHIARNSISPADLLRRLNHAMLHTFSRGKFLTILCAFIDTQRHTLSIARGGHEKPLLISRDQSSGNVEAEFLESKGLGIGISKAEIFDKTISEIVCPYQFGDTLILYTDGLTEAQNPEGEEFGTERLLRAAKLAQGQDAENLNKSILAELKAFTRSKELQDDLTIVAIKSI